MEAESLGALFKKYAPHAHVIIQLEKRLVSFEFVPSGDTSAIRSRDIILEPEEPLKVEKFKILFNPCC